MAVDRIFGLIIKDDKSIILDIFLYSDRLEEIINIISNYKQ